MGIVTITSDFGGKDYYLARIKGAILCAAPDWQIVDVAHDIDNYDIVQAAFVFGQAWSSFPEGTIHLVSVNDFPVRDGRFVAIQRQGHYFIGPDNGLFSLVFQESLQQVRVLPAPRESRFPLSAIYGEAIGHLAGGASFDTLGRPAEGIVQRITFQPVISASQIRGSVIYIDNFENAVVNISKELFEQVGRGRAFALYFKRHEPLRNLVTHFHDVGVGEPLCRFNSAGYLEIAVNMGRACTLLGLNVEDMVQIDFEGVGAQSILSE